MKTLKWAWCYVWYFFTESETFVYILIGAALIMFGMFLERTW